MVELGQVFEMAKSSLGCLHPDEGKEREAWLEDFRCELLGVLERPGHLPSDRGHIKRGVKRVRTDYEEHNGRNHKSWWRVKVHTVVLDCGHEKVYRGDVYPKRYSRCRECEALRDSGKSE